MLIAAYTPMARLRGGPSGNVVAISDSAAGATMAPPTPCRARAPSSQASVVAKPPSSEASENRMTPAMSTRRLPRMSLSPAAEQQQATEGERVGVDDPFEAGPAEAERLLDVGECDVDDGRVQHHHQLGGGDDHQRQAETAVTGPGTSGTGDGPPGEGLCG